MLDGFDVVYVEKKECNKSIKTSTKIGARIPAYITADGKIILSYLDDDKLNEYVPEKIKKLTPNTITDRNKLLKVLHEMKNKGYATDNEEVVQGISCVAAPIIEHTGRVRFSLSITGPTVRMTKDKMKEYVDIISEAAKEISFRIGYRG